VRALVCDVRAEHLTSAEVAALAVVCPFCGKAAGEFCAAGGSMSLMANGRAWHHQRFYAAANAFAGCPAVTDGA
jgi:hypothetical protein